MASKMTFALSPSQHGEQDDRFPFHIWGKHLQQRSMRMVHGSGMPAVKLWACGGSFYPAYTRT